MPIEYGVLQGNTRLRRQEAEAHVQLIVSQETQDVLYADSMEYAQDWLLTHGRVGSIRELPRVQGWLVLAQKYHA